MPITHPLAKNIFIVYPYRFFCANNTPSSKNMFPNNLPWNIFLSLLLCLLEKIYSLMTLFEIHPYLCFCGNNTPLLQKYFHDFTFVPITHPFTNLCSPMALIEIHPYLCFYANNTPPSKNMLKIRHIFLKFSFLNWLLIYYDSIIKYHLKCRFKI